MLDAGWNQIFSFPEGHNCILQGPGSNVVEMQVCTVPSAFGQRGVNVHQRLAQVVVPVQCGQRKPEPSWCRLPELSELRADQTHCGRKYLILLMCATGLRYCRAQVMCEDTNFSSPPYFSPLSL